MQLDQLGGVTRQGRTFPREHEHSAGTTRPEKGRDHFAIPSPVQHHQVIRRELRREKRRDLPIRPPVGKAPRSHRLMHLREFLAQPRGVGKLAHIHPEDASRKATFDLRPMAPRPRQLRLPRAARPAENDAPGAGLLQ